MDFVFLLSSKKKTIMIEAGAETETLAAALVPIFLVAGFGVKYDVTADGTKRGGTRFEQAIEVLPRKYTGVES